MDLEEAAIQYIQQVYNEAKDQKLAMDRWFRLYLIISGAVLTIFSWLVVGNNNALNSILPAASGVMTLIGFFSLMAFIKQRTNNIRLYAKKDKIERDILYPLLRRVPDPQIKPEDNRGIKPGKYGAHFWMSLVYIVLNTSWITVTIFFIMGLFDNVGNACIYVTCSIVAIVAFVVQVIIRHLKLSNIENWGSEEIFNSREDFFRIIGLL